MNKEILLTADGKKKLEEELHELVTVRRHEVSERIKEAKSFGDLSENSEYDDAKNEQGWVETRVIEITQILENAHVAETSKRPTKVGVGTQVEVKNVASGVVTEFKIVGSAERDPANREISDESPVGAALKNHKKGDVVDVYAPSGIIKFEIVSIKPIKR